MANKYITFWSVAIFVFVLDIVTKLLVAKNIPLNRSIDFPFFSISHILNTGTAFGVLKNASWFFVVFAVAVSVFLILKYKTFAKNIQPILGLILGGAVGNLVDRLLYGAVIDFIDFHFWPAFNVADTAISVAVVLILLREYWPQKRNI